MPSTPVFGRTRNFDAGNNNKRPTTRWNVNTTRGHHPRRRRTPISGAALLFLTLFLSFLISTTFIFVAHQNILEGEEAMGGMGIENKMTSTLLPEKEKPHHKEITKHDKSRDRKNNTSHLLSCAHFNSLSDEYASEMVYWNDDEEDSFLFEGKLYSELAPLAGDEEEKFLTVEWGGGWNNVRMCIETSIAMALAMGRTLVLPPEQKIYLLEEEAQQHQKRQFSFSDFFDLEKIMSKYHEYLSIITMEEFLSRVAMQGKLVNKRTGLVEFPANNRTNWDGEEVLRDLWRYLRRTSTYDKKDWKPSESIFVFDSIGGKRRRNTNKAENDRGYENIDNSSKEILDTLRQMMKEVNEGQDKFFSTQPPAIDGSAIDRFKEILPLRRKNIVLYDVEARRSNHILLESHDNLFTNFYAYLFFMDWKDDIWLKHFIRNNLRYMDELQCISAKIVQAICDRSRQNNSANTNGYFDSFHVRRGDFAEKVTRVDVTKLYESSKDKLQEGATIYIATDEKDLSFFEPLRKHYDVCFLSDFAHLYEGMNTNYKGMLDQLVASKGRVFFGTWKSTFTSYIHRLRGYHNAKKTRSRYDDGSLQSYYFVPEAKKYEMVTYSSVTTHWMREFSIAWRDF